ncbi:MAG: SxtJ family membrane protein, partial [Pyrinomonadaceae bacterium]
TIAFALGWVNSRIILTIIYFLVFVPYSIVSRLLGRDVLKRRQPNGTSYWHMREKTRQSKEQFERLF